MTFHSKLNSPSPIRNDKVAKLFLFFPSNVHLIPGGTWHQSSHFEIMVTNSGNVHNWHVVHNLLNYLSHCHWPQIMTGYSDSRSFNEFWLKVWLLMNGIIRNDKLTKLFPFFPCNVHQIPEKLDINGHRWRNGHNWHIVHNLLNYLPCCTWSQIMTCYHMTRTISTNSGW